jgi:tetratricopeptide (TPR) repeat protein
MLHRLMMNAQFVRSTRIRVLFLLLSAQLLPALASFGQSRPATESFDALAKKAAEAKEANRLDDAVSLYKSALAVRPKWAEGWWSLGMLEYDRNNYRTAARAFRQFLPLAPKDGTANAILGLCEFELGQDDLALKHLERAKTLGISTNPQLRLVLLYHEGILLLRANKFRSAQTALSALCQDISSNEDVIKSLGLAVFRVSPKSGPPEGTPGAKIMRRAGHAACITAQKKYDEARKEYSDLVTEYPNYPNIHYAFGRFLAESNDVSGAIEEFKQELKNNPGDVNSRLEIAAAHYKLDSAAGLPYAEEAVHLNPHLPFGHYLLGLLYLDTDSYQKAIPELEIAQKSFPRDARLYFVLGSAYARAGRREDARKARAKYEQLNKESGEDATASY